MDSSIKLLGEHMPTDPLYRGCSFVLSTAQPPKLNDQVIRKDHFSYREENSISISKYILSLGQTPIYFIKFYDKSTSGKEISITREELSIAWITGLNYYRHWHRLQEIVPEDLDFETYNRRNELLDEFKEWTDCFSELELALGMLTKLEQTGKFPKKWPMAYPDHIPSFSEYRFVWGLRSNAGPETLTSLFIHAALRMSHLDQINRSNAFQDLEERFGFKGFPVCSVYGLTTFERIERDENEVTE
ncbi:uncharacterized protein I206_107091 [Kwoniella pini CBS 10737]|uniref:Uncharacterized protein n=1 Tax=Kwoniella pini CBS 10737 TaxID=1296096 RepID=A0A1B9HZ86_9TREE|nr:uncharacterized protein I206_05365 [Kwoniella pini CBS 10737]OCF48586.1 hypothetical protein I206_05365 [Kwoniella pini CBS 10737]